MYHIIYLAPYIQQETKYLKIGVTIWFFQYKPCN